MSEIELDEIEELAVESSCATLSAARFAYENAVADRDSQAKLNQERVDQAAEQLAAIEAEHERLLRAVLARRGERDPKAVRLVSDEKGSRLVAE